MKSILISVVGIKDSKEILRLFQNLLWRPENVVLLYVEHADDDAMLNDRMEDVNTESLKKSESEHGEKLANREITMLDYYRKELEKSGLRNIRTICRKGDQAMEILKTAEEENADLIVMSYGEKIRKQGLIMDCVSTEVEKNAKVPVIITKRPVFTGHY